MPSVPMPKPGARMSALIPRPALGARVRVKPGTDLGVTGHLGTVDAYHADGIATWVKLDGSHRRLLFEPSELELLTEDRP